jgi:virginiamycin B lyase
MNKQLLFSLALTLLTALLAACTILPGASPATNGQATPVTATFHEYPLPQPASGVMRPAIDHEGRLWFGEMGRNALGVFDPHTGTFQQLTPPHGASGIMGIAVAPDDSIWFAEQYANYIGHYMPAAHQYHIYPLPTLTPPQANSVQTIPYAPNDIALDAQGRVWFTEMNADAIAMLDPHTGAITHYPITTQRTIQTYNPYGITVDAQGTVWFTTSTRPDLGRLDPRTGKIQMFALPDKAITLMEITSDAYEHIWATAFNTGLVFQFDPTTQAFTSYPASPNTSSGLYGITVAPSGTIWVALTPDNAIARLDLTTKRFTSYAIPTEDSMPLGLVVDKENTVWFTELSGNKIGQLQI